ncbi:MAG: S-ribosylhomocysteine lyase [Clostridia bacterium]|nr:S-ribosylhomocysteine lyase [Clostridia bacterium]
MKTIQSFTVDHTKLLPGLYVSRVDGDATTFDLRCRRPNGGDYLDNLTMHSLEHLFATFVRNGPHAERILYFGPMGCQTGFYLIVRGLDPETVKKEVFRVLQEILRYDGPMPGGSERECGNYRNLDVAAAKTECRRYLNELMKRKIDFQYEV